MKKTIIALSAVISIISSLSLAEAPKEGNQCTIHGLPSDCKLGLCNVEPIQGVYDADGYCKTLGQSCTFYKAAGSPWYKRMLNFHEKKSGTVQIKRTSPHEYILHCTDEVVAVPDYHLHRRPPLPLGLNIR